MVNYEIYVSVAGKVEEFQSPKSITIKRYDQEYTLVQP